VLRVDLGRIGFRSVGVAGGDLDAFRFEVNGEPVYCRGASWTPLDPARLAAPAEQIREALVQARDAGMNMLRISGALLYESEEFHRLCDEIGILVWQDFAFANFDYPTDEPFLDLCRREAEQLLARTAGRCSLAVACGGSEVQQQAAMMGLPREEWDHVLFDETLPGVCARERPDLIYVPSSPCRGDLPFHVRSGPGHYFGVGAYLRPIEDASLARVRFAAECLAFSNVPEDDSPARERSPERGVPRDPAADWDFADVTDHYVAALFGVDARASRATDPDRHRSMSRIAVGEAMAAVQHRWRARESGCSGALVWLLRDLRPGAGWGLVDASGVPKAPYYFLARAWAPVAVWLVDEGVNGVQLHLANDTARARQGTLAVELHRANGALAEATRLDVEVPERSGRSWNVEALLGHFADASYAYRFGPPGHDAVVARFESHADGAEPGDVATAFLFPNGVEADAAGDVGLAAIAEPLADGGYRVTATAERLARWVAVEAPGFRPSDAYFHVAPGSPHRFRLSPLDSGTPFRAMLRPWNAPAATPVGEGEPIRPFDARKR
jgi:beta-mannosidase